MLPKIAIPSYQRIETLKTKTLKMLELYTYPKELIYIFTAPEEFNEYTKEFVAYNVIAGLKGLKYQRNFIIDYFEEGEELVCMDDDIEQILILDPEGKDIKRGTSILPNLQEFILHAFELCKEKQLNIFGIYPIYNYFFMKATITTDCKFLIGHFYGIINIKSIKNTLCLKDDYERSLHFYKRDGGVLRFNYICAKTKMYKSGGLNMSQQQRLMENKESCKTLITLFPGLVRMNTRKEGEIILLSKKKENNGNNESTEANINRTTTSTIKRSRKSIKKSKNTS